MKLTRFTALFTFITFVVAIPVEKAHNEVTARSGEEVRALAAVSDTNLAKRDLGPIVLEERQLGSLINSLFPLLSGIPVVGPLLINVLSLIGSNVPLRDLQTGAKSIQDLSKETGVSADDLKELLSYLSTETIPGVVSKRQVALPGINVSGLITDVIPILGQIAVVGPLAATILLLVQENTPLRDVQTGAKSIEDLSKETGASVDNIKQVFSLLPPGTIPGI